MSVSNDVEGGGGGTNGGALAFPEEQAAAPALSKQHRSNKRLMVVSILTLALIGLVVGLSVGLTTRNQNRNTSSAATTTTTTDTDQTTSSSQFVQTKEYIDTVCSSDNDDNKTECEKACEPVECCNPLAENNCLATNTEECMAYAKCHVVTGLGSSSSSSSSSSSTTTATSTAARSDLIDKCSRDDKTACSEECEDVTCCLESFHDHEASCLDTQFLMCVDYGACQVLKPNTAIDQPAPANLADLCANPDTRGQCENACSHASCCWANDDDTNCLHKDMISCLTYAPCGLLEIQLPNSVVERPTTDFHDDCSIESILTDAGYDKCMDHCVEATCCWDDDDSENCFTADPIGCLQHLPCGLLPFAGGTLEPADEDELKQACNWQTIMRNEEGSSMDECLAKCDPAKCCIAEDDEENCFDNGNALACASYAPCLAATFLAGFGFGDIVSGGGGGDDASAIFPDFGGFPNFGAGAEDGTSTLEAPPGDLSVTCSMANLATDAGRDACEGECEKVACCTSTGDDNCFMANLVMCATWNLQGCFAVNSNFQT